MSNRLTTEEFVQKANLVHNQEYTYDHVVYVNNHTKVSIDCKQHGAFMQIPNAHLSGQGCPICRNAKIAKALTKTTDKFIEDAIAVHGTKYSYSKTVYKNSHIPVVISCPIHGEFSQCPIDHTACKAGCPRCGAINSKLNYLDKATVLYYVKLINENLYKIGITTRALHKRFAGVIDNIQILDTVEFTSGILAFTAEQTILNKYKEYQYVGTPVLKGGNTELFTIDILPTGIMSILKDQ